MEKLPFPAASTGPSRSLPKLDTKNISGLRRGDTWVGQFELPPTTTSERIWRRIKKEATFFRIHATAFIFLPLIASGVFHACNGQYHIEYIDSLFLTYSAMTVTGLSTVNLSTLTPLQQVILYVLMAVGDITTISWIMVLIRKRFFRTHCEYIVRSKHRLRPRSKSFMRNINISSPINVFKPRDQAPRQDGLRTRVTMDGDVSVASPRVEVQGVTSPTDFAGNDNERQGTAEMLDALGMTGLNPPGIQIPPGGLGAALLYRTPTRSTIEHDSDTQMFDGELRASPQSGNVDLPPTPTVDGNGNGSSYGLSPTISRAPAIGFAETTTFSPRTYYQRGVAPEGMSLRSGVSRDGRQVPFRGATILSNKGFEVPGTNSTTKDPKYRDFGGFPGPTHLASQVLKLTAPNVHRQLKRRMTVPSVQTVDEGSASWWRFGNLIVGRNSNFHTETLTDDQLEDLGGAEYRALRLLSYLVPAYFVTTQLVALVIFLPWFASVKTYDGVFEGQYRLVSKPWFAFFQMMAAYTGGGLTLVDMGMIPFQEAYLMIIGMIFVILAGNHALPIFLRFIIWVASKIFGKDTDSHKALSFLLDHPRRCFLYLFPSHQTWFLVICLVVFSIIEWVTFLVLNIGLPAYQSIPPGPRVLAGLFQGLAARASGFSIVPIASLAPALQFLYVVMMYIAVYPVALSIRSTNVYEERSLGVFEEPDEDDDEEPTDIGKLKTRRERIGRYVGWHWRKQMSIDIWWLVWGVFLVAIVERGNILDEEKKWFDMFRVLFELVSAFGGIGLSLGLPSDNYSFVGAMKPVSKLVVIVIMVRGRHRGLPVAIDRAVMLPNELVTNRGDPQILSGGITDVTGVRTPHVQSPLAYES